MQFPQIPPLVSLIIFTLWILQFLLGRSQLNKITNRLTKIALDQIVETKKEKENLSVDQYYAHLYPQFVKIVKSNSKFIPHKTELFPMPATPDYVKKRINFTPEWLGAFMLINGHPLNANREQKKAIDQIMMFQKSPTTRQK
jgi:hypothetical protein